MPLKKLKTLLGWKYYKDITALPARLRDRFFVLFSVPKSGANTLIKALDGLLAGVPPTLRTPPAMVLPGGLDNQLPLHRDLARLFPDGGWWHTHTEASFPTLEVLRATGAKHLVLLRHPLDQLVANYCHLRKHQATNRGVPGHPDWMYAMPFGIYRRKTFHPATPVEAGLTQMVADGALSARLRWMADWAAFRDAANSRLLLYEDFIQDPLRLLGDICAFLQPRLTLSAAQINEAVERAGNAYKQQSLNFRGDIAYPRGWTGKIGTWRDYLSADNLIQCRGVMGEFMRTHPTAPALAKIYPDTAGNGGPAT